MSRKLRKTQQFKKSKLESKVWKVPTNTIQRDDTGRYLPYCTFSRHAGVVKRPEVCDKRKCKFYYKLYFPDRNYGNL